MTADGERPTASDLLLNLGDRLEPRHVAVLVVDMQNDFCAAGGYIERVVKKDPSACSRVAGPVNRLADLARRSGIPVFWLRADYDPGGLPESMRARLAAHGISEGCCIPGTWGHDWHGVQPEPGECVIDKHSYDGFIGTRLDLELQAGGIRTLIFAGVQTNICVETTLRHAHALGYYCVLIEDCVASHTAPAHEMTLATVRFLLGDVISLVDVARHWLPRS